jgi:ubiquinone/menaquinone biosynthesis C-methylase UbiE
MTTASVIRRTDIYNDPAFNYSHYWQGREYEHQAEVMALRRLLRGRRFGHAIDVGGGYGRLSVVLSEFADKVTLVDPSAQQLELSLEILPESSAVDRQLMDAANLQFPDQSADLVTLIRVLHHLPDPAAELAELARILRPGGYAVIEAANSAHAANRMGHLIRGKRVPQTVMDIRSEETRKRGSAPFVNHHPRAISRQLADAGFQVRQVLSVSNLRHPVAKNVLPGWFMISVERAAQRPLARVHFGPSIFFLLQKQAPARVAGRHRQYRDTSRAIRSGSSRSPYTPAS